MKSFVEETYSPAFGTVDLHVRLYDFDRRQFTPDQWRALRLAGKLLRGVLGDGACHAAAATAMRELDEMLS